MKRYAVIGRDIAYSISPIIHNEHFKFLEIDAIYECFDMKKLEINPLKTYQGFNVTIPYKEQIINNCFELSKEAKEICAVNCVKVVNDQFYGYNTDVYGFYQLLVKNHLLKEEKKVLVIGAGGAGKAVYYCLLNYTKHDVYVTNKTIDKALKLTSKVISFDVVSQYITDFDIIINCTSVGVKERQSPIKIKQVKKNACFIDINYQSKSLFLDVAKKLNAKTINGFDMLIYQAAKSFEIWFQKKANIKAMYESIRKG